MVLKDYEGALRYVYGFHRAHLAGELQGRVVRRLLEYLGVRDVLGSEHVTRVTGTNGKGSTCAYVERFLRAHGRQTVMLTSPHLNSIRERIRVDGGVIGKEAFVQVLRRAQPALEWGRGTQWHPSPMMIMSLLAVLVQHERGVASHGVYEVGAGGMHDSTNIFDRGVVGLTRVGGDHAPEFGGTVVGVLLEKLGLCVAGGSLVHVAQAECLQRVLAEYCRRRRISIEEVTSECIAETGRWLGKVLLPGWWQQENAALALALYRRQVPDADDARGLARRLGSQRVTHCGRLERRSVGGRMVILDGAHNPPAISQLLEYCARQPRAGCGGLAGIVGLSMSKDWQKMMRQIMSARLFTTLALTKAMRPGGVEPTVLAAYAARHTAARVVALPCLRQALAWTLERSEAPILVCGSLRLVGDFDRALHALGFPEDAIPMAEIDPVQPWMACP